MGGIKLSQLLKRPQVEISDIQRHFGLFEGIDRFILDYVQNEIKYEGYLQKEDQQIERMERYENREIPPGLDYMKMGRAPHRGEAKACPGRPTHRRAGLARLGRVSRGHRRPLNVHYKQGQEDMNDTICAIATPIGIGGVGIVRMSGPKSCEISDKFFTARGGKKPSGFTPYRMYYGTLDLGSFSDSCLCVRFSAPNSFTGEDVVEFHCHSGAALLQGVLRALIDLWRQVCPVASSQRGHLSTQAHLPRLRHDRPYKPRTEAQLRGFLADDELSRKIENCRGARQLLPHRGVH